MAGLVWTRLGSGGGATRVTCPVHGVAQGGGDTWVWGTALSSEALGGR